MHFGKVTAAVIVSLNLFFVSAIADDDTSNTEEFEIDALTCWEVMTLPEDESAYVLMLLYGYSAGKQNQSTQSGELIANTIAAAGEFCGENPDMSAIQAFIEK